MCDPGGDRRGDLRASLRSHFALTFVVDRFDERVRRWIGTFVTAVVSVFLLVFAWQAAKFTFAVRDQIAPGTRMSMAIPYSSALVGSVLMLYYVLETWWNGPEGADGGAHEIGAAHPPAPAAPDSAAAAPADPEA